MNRRLVENSYIYINNRRQCALCFCLKAQVEGSYPYHDTLLSTAVSGNVLRRDVVLACGRTTRT